MTPKGSFRWARRRGFNDQSRGVGRDECPYGDRRTARGLITWSRAFGNAWRDGWDEGKDEETKRSAEEATR